MTNRHSRHISPCGWPWKVNKRVSMPPTPTPTKPNAPSHMYYEIQSKKLPRKQNISVRNRNRDVCDSRFISIFSPFTFWSGLLYLHIRFFLFLKIPFFFFSSRSLLITLYTPWAQMPPVKMQENAKRLKTQTQWTNIIQDHRALLAKPHTQLGASSYSDGPASPHLHFSLLFCAHVRTRTRG